MYMAHDIQKKNKDQHLKILWPFCEASKNGFRLSLVIFMSPKGGVTITTQTRRKREGTVLCLPDKGFLQQELQKENDLSMLSRKTSNSDT